MKIFARIIEVLFPKECFVCGKEQSFLCKKHIPQDVQKHEYLDPLDKLFYFTHYHNKVVEKSLELFKFKGNQEFAEILGSCMEKSIPDEVLFEIIIPIPLHWTRMFFRGFNQANLLAKHIGKKRNIPVFSFLKRQKHTKQQAKLKKEAREKNMKNIFVVQQKGNKVPHSVLLIDDIYTTGATLKEAAKTLKESGVKKVYGAVFART